MSTTELPVDAADGPVVAVEDLTVRFGGPRSASDPVVRGISFTIHRGTCLAIVGESGSGKSVTARSLLGLAGPGAQVSATRLEHQGVDLRQAGPGQWRELRGRGVGYVLQDALVALDPLRPVGREIGAALSAHGAGNRRDRAARVRALTTAVGLPEPALQERQRPGELSGGLRQRALIASAIAMDPALVIADEPTTALDVTVQAQILGLLRDLRRAGTALLVISHDLAVVAALADEVIVVRNGGVVERGPTAQVLGTPQHPYTRQLLAAVPTGGTRGHRLSGPEAGTPYGERADGSVRTGAAPILRLDRVQKRFRGPDRRWRTAVDGASLDVHAGESVGVVGESGSGKTTLGRLALALEHPDGGSVRFDGQPWSGGRERDRHERRALMTTIQQDPLGAFDPRWTVGRIVAEGLRRTDGEPRGAERAVGELLERVGLGAAYAARRPLELSGGQRQRVAIARALAPDPLLVVCDEPVSALDVSIQAQILDLLVDLQRERQVAYLFISHDLGVVHHLCDRVAVLQRGAVVETGTADQVFTAPRHEYTRELLAAVPRLPAGTAAPTTAEPVVAAAIDDDWIAARPEPEPLRSTTR